MKKSPSLPFAIYADPKVRAQARLQGYMDDQVSQMQQLSYGLSKADQDLVDMICVNRRVLQKLPPVRAENLPDKPPITGLDIGYTILPYTTLVQLARHEETCVRAMLALNLGPETRHQKPAEILARDPAHLVRRSLALNLFAQPYILSILAQDEDVWVRRRVAYHVYLPKPLRLRMAADPNEDDDVRTIAAMRLEESGRI